MQFRQMKRFVSLYDPLPGALLLVWPRGDSQLVPFLAGELVMFDVMAACLHIKVAGASHHQFGCLSIVESEGSHIAMLENQPEPFAFLHQLSHAMLRLVHGVNDHARYFSSGIV